MADDKHDNNDSKCTVKDELVPGPAIGNGRLFVRHNANHEVSVGVLHPVKEGENIAGRDVLRLDHIEGQRYAVTELNSTAKPTSAPASSDKTGPAQVNTKNYRDGWDRIFGTKPTVGQA